MRCYHLLIAILNVPGEGAVFAYVSPWKGPSPHPYPVRGARGVRGAGTLRSWAVLLGAAGLQRRRALLRAFRRSRAAGAVPARAWVNVLCI